jgi:hypothetical protein
LLLFYQARIEMLGSETTVGDSTFREIIVKHLVSVVVASLLYFFVTYNHLATATSPSPHSTSPAARRPKPPTKFPTPVTMAATPDDDDELAAD